jgi:hypothetical protein
MSMPKVNLVRSASMQAEEMVLQARRSARTFTERNLLAAAGVAASTRVAGGVSDAEQAALNAQAIREVDELAEAVEESGDEDEAGGHQRRATKASAEASAPVSRSDTGDGAAAAAAAAAGGSDGPTRGASMGGNGPASPSQLPGAVVAGDGSASTRNLASGASSKRVLASPGSTRAAGETKGSE